MAAVKLEASSPLSSFSSFHFSSSSGSRSLTPPRFHLISVKIPIFDGPLRSRLVSVCCQNPNSDSVIVDQTVPGYDTGSKGPDRFPDDHGQTSASSPSSAIDFLALCHRLKAEKSRWEQAALKQMCEILGGVRAEEIKELWEEYENNSSLEANLVKDFDKVEMILQALEYELEHGKMLDEF